MLTSKKKLQLEKRVDDKKKIKPNLSRLDLSLEDLEGDCWQKVLITVTL